MSTLPSIIKKQTAILNRLFQLRKTGISPAGARAILEIDFEQVDIDRMHELSLKAQCGMLSKEEDEEADFYSTWGTIVEILHSKARLALKKRGLPTPVKPPPVPTESKLENQRRRTK